MAIPNFVGEIAGRRVYAVPGLGDSCSIRVGNLLLVREACPGRALAVAKCVLGLQYNQPVICGADSCSARDTIRP